MNDNNFKCKFYSAGNLNEQNFKNIKNFKSNSMTINDFGKLNDLRKSILFLIFFFYIQNYWFYDVTITKVFQVSHFWVKKKLQLLL